MSQKTDKNDANLPAKKKKKHANLLKVFSTKFYYAEFGFKQTHRAKARERRGGRREGRYFRNNNHNVIISMNKVFEIYA